MSPCSTQRPSGGPRLAELVLKEGQKVRCGSKAQAGSISVFPAFPALFQPQLAPYRVGIYPKLALSIAQAVLDESKLPGICVRGRDAQDDCTQGHVLKDSFLQHREQAGLPQPGQ